MCQVSQQYHQLWWQKLKIPIVWKINNGLHIKKSSGDGEGRDVKCQYSVSGHYLKKNDSVYFKLGVYSLVSVFRNYSILSHFGLIMALW